MMLPRWPRGAAVVLVRRWQRMAPVRAAASLARRRSTGGSASPVHHHGLSQRSGRDAARRSPLHGGRVTGDLKSSESSVSARLAPVEAEAVAFVAPDAVNAYRHRVASGLFESVLDLERSPYAAPPLAILDDVVGAYLRQRDEPHASATCHRHHSNSSRSSGNDHHGGRRSCDDALQPYEMALSNTLHIRQLLQRAMARARAAVEAVEEIGDQQSTTHVQECVSQLRAFAATVRQLQDAAVAPHWSVPSAVCAELHRAVLHQAALVGAVDLAVQALQELLRLSDAAAAAAETHDGGGDDGDGGFLLDDVVALTEAELQQQTRTVTAADHIAAVRSCATTREFDVALALYNRFLQHAAAGAFPLAPSDVTDATVALARSSRNAAHFAELRRAMAHRELAAAVPVSVPLYTALIDAASRAETNPQQMDIALSLYRRLRDAQMAPVAETYAALIACCATAREPTHAFAFYHEALATCGPASLAPAVYTNLLRAYARGGYGRDVRQMLDVLVEAGAPLTRATFHAALSCAPTRRDAIEMVTLMETKYHIAASPHTYAYVIHATAKQPAGVESVLDVFDLHTAAVTSLGADDAAAGGVSRSGAGFVAPPEALPSPLSDEVLCDKYPPYVRAVEHALLGLRVDPAMDPRLAPFLTPLVRLAQRRMTQLLGGMAPQRPTTIPRGAYVAVLAADVLANIQELVLPFLPYYAAVVVPYSAVVGLLTGSGRRVDGALPKGQSVEEALLSDGFDHEQEAVAASRLSQLKKFLHEWRDVVHLVSLEEEVRLSRDVARYGVERTNLLGRSAVLALHLARRDTAPSTGSTSRPAAVYAASDCVMVLVSTNFDQCGRYVVDRVHHHHAAATEAAILFGRPVGRAGHVGDADAAPTSSQQVRGTQVLYHNPATNPSWAPPEFSAITARGSPPSSFTATATAATTPPPCADESGQSQDWDAEALMGLLAEDT